MAALGKDLWYQVVSATERYLTPINGAGFAVWGGSAPGMSDCIGASKHNQYPAFQLAGGHLCLL